MKETINQRGFKGFQFVDSYGESCSITASSSAMESKIWMGVDDPQLTVFEDEGMGKYHKINMPKQYMVSTHMHLTQQMVIDMLPLLTKFAETGEL